LAGSIRRCGESKDSLGSASGDEAGEPSAAESPPGLMSRTLGSITALPSLFVKSTDSSSSGTGAAASTPSPTRSAPAPADRSPGPTRPSRAFFFHRLVGRSTTDSGIADTADASRTADDGVCVVYDDCSSLSAAIGWLGSRVVSVLDSGAEGPGSNRSRDAVG